MTTCKHSQKYDYSGWLAATAGSQQIVYGALAGWDTATSNGSVTYQFGYQNQNQTQAITMPDFYSSLLGYQVYYPTYGVVNHLPPETPAEKVARLKRSAEREAAREVASKRAEKLLFTILTPTQVKQYTDDDYFEVPVNERLYRIRKGVSRNVELIEAGKRTALYCAHPKDAYDVPVPDVMLSQLLMIRANEAEFLRIANRTVVQ